MERKLAAIFSAEFASVVNAVRCAVEIQQELKTRMEGRVTRAMS